MGGIVAAETVLDIISDSPLTQSQTLDGSQHGFMFPYIQGILAFDTPYLGISPGVVAYGAEGHYHTASTTFTQLSSLLGTGGGSSSWWSAGKSTETSQTRNAAASPGNNGPVPIKGLLPAPVTPPPGPTPPDQDAAATPAWQRWGKLAMYAGAAGAVAAGGAAAYLKREQITQGWSWVGGHLEFVGCLVRGEELRTRLERIVELERERGMGFVDLYTVLGRGAVNTTKTFAANGKNGGAGGGSGGGSSLAMMNTERSFCNLPKTELFKSYFRGTLNDKASDETGAHMSMFFPKDNPGYYHMADQAKGYIVEWVVKGWSLSSSTPTPTMSPETMDEAIV
ncbi:MAG: hypothetical protein M1823_005140 [Watsoniomyces obsoletus]|nr:MAG: hypothetical protein M1823_005140 [Watsoniomyces obsoletus]